MGTLWLKFPDEMLSGLHLSEKDRRKFEQIFSMNDGSEWMQALQAIGLRADKKEPLIKWYKNAPYFNWSSMVDVISGGAFSAVPDAANGYKLAADYKLKQVGGLLKTHWMMMRFMQREEHALPPIVESIALGIVLQSFILRLGANSFSLSQWLSDVDQAPKKHRETLRLIQDIQMRRTALSSSWHAVFSGKGEDVSGDLPDFFWDDQVLQEKREEPKDTSNWQAKPVCAGQVTGIVLVVDFANLRAQNIEETRTRYNVPVILLFPQARPESVELFGKANAVLFAQGGVLSHACTVAREMRIPSLTELGQNFLDFAKSKEKLWISIDGATGKIEVIE